MFDFAVNIGLAGLFEHFKYLHVLLSCHVIILIVVTTLE